MRGGARTRSGPPPDPTALRRERDSNDWVKLPAAGRTGRTPTWPLTDPHPRELHLWRGLWHTPQSLMWEALGQEIEVALYVRRLCEAEVHESATNLSTLVRQLADSLGLTTPGLRASRWTIVDEEPVEQHVTAPTSSIRSRLQVVADGTGA
jgi:hypothetical protein